MSNLAFAAACSLLPWLASPQEPLSGPSARVQVRLSDLPGPWTNPFQTHPRFSRYVKSHGASVKESPDGPELIITATMKQSSDVPLPVMAEWKTTVPFDELTAHVHNRSEAEVGISLSVRTTQNEVISSAPQVVAGGGSRLLRFDMFDAEPTQVPGSRVEIDSLWVRLHGLRAGCDYCVAFREVAFCAIPPESALALAPIDLQGIAGKSLRLSWNPEPVPASATALPAGITIERGGQVFLRAATTVCGIGNARGLASLDLTLPLGMPGGSYTVMADTRRVPVSGQPARRAQVGTLEVASTPPPRPRRVSVEPHHGAPALFIEDRPVAGLKYMTNGLDERYVGQFAVAGVEVVGFEAACGEHPNRLAATSWPEPDRLDFTELDARVTRILSAHPRARLLPRVYIAAPQWWAERYADQCALAMTADGQYRPYEEPRGRRPGSWASRKWREDMGRVLAEMVRHMRTAPYADRVLGLMICAGSTSEWMFPGSALPEWADYSEPTIQGLRDWLRKRYGTDEHLRTAWCDPTATLETALPPRPADATAGGTGEFVDAAHGRRLPDWWLYVSDLTVDTIEHFTRVAKETSGGEWLCGVFYGYVIQFHEPRILRAGHLAIDRLARSPFVDFVSSPTLYSHRSLAPGGYSTFMSLTDTFRLHNKLWWNENDIRTFRVLDIPVSGIDRRQTPDETKNLLWREIGNVLSHSCNQWYFDMRGGWYDDADLMATVRRQVQVADLALQRDRSSVAEVAVVIDPQAFTEQTVFSTVNSWLVLGQVAELGRMGAPFEVLSLADIELLPPRKLWVFLNLFAPTSEQIARIHSRLKRDKAVGLFVYGCGHAAKPEVRQELTGMAIIADHTRRRADVRVAAGELGLTRESVYGTSSKVGPARFRGGEVTPTFHVAGADVKVLGVDAASGQPALCLKHRDGWASVYSAAPCVSESVLRGLAQMAGVHLYVAEDAVVYANASVLSVTVADAGRRQIMLREPSEVVDAISGKTLATRATSFECDFGERESRLFLYQRCR